MRELFFMALGHEVAHIKVGDNEPIPRVGELIVFDDSVYTITDMSWDLMSAQTEVGYNIQLTNRKAWTEEGSTE